MLLDSRQMLIVKLGATFPELSKNLGDFEDWIGDAIKNLDYSINVLYAQDSPRLFEPSSYIGVILTGSSSMVTDQEEWSERLKPWLIKCMEQQIPILGICYGHQLLAETFGGKVENRVNGVEIGTVTITRGLASQTDVLFKNLPIAFPAHTVHWQSVTRLPSNAVLLAASQLDKHHAFRIGNRVWGVQFHPEFLEESMSYYINEYSQIIEKEGKDSAFLLKNIKPTNNASTILKRFGEFCINSNLIGSSFSN
ncbi:glutamine amidotransferase [Acinetobacter lactucae]|uniref:glutamine amidotransferase n=1 Tax=Acinetobacter lactucae TaxID=1785128 RepID=UPI0015F75739|nr:glutamine amidotransferase [Acinetobacter lactucae]